MEPVTIILASFFGYYVGSDFANYMSFCREMNKIHSRFDTIDTKLNNMMSNLKNN
jgi:hypothetical protein